MAVDIFSSDVSWGGSFQAENASLTFPGLTQRGAGLLLQNLQLTYVRSIQRFYELSSHNFYYFAGRTQGTFSIGSVVGPAAVSNAFIQTYSGVCNPRNIDLSLNSGFCAPNQVKSTTAPTVTYSLAYTVISGISLAVAAVDMVINQSVNGLFGALQQSGQNPVSLP